MDVLSFLLIIVAAIIGAAISYFFAKRKQTQIDLRQRQKTKSSTSN